MVRRLLMVVMAAGMMCAGVRAEDQAIPLGSDDPRHTFARAGYSDCLACCTQPSETPKECGYYVGGACVCFGGAPGPLQGTFGWDYCGGHWCPHKVIIGFCYRCRYKGGTGDYRTDGKPVPDVLAIHPPDRHCEHGGCCVPTPP